MVGDGMTKHDKIASIIIQYMSVPIKLLLLQWAIFKNNSDIFFNYQFLNDAGYI